MSKSLLSLLQLCDSALPIGGYSHSYGLETWVQLGTLTNANQVEEALAVLLEQSVSTTDGIVCALAYDAAAIDDRVRLTNLDRILEATKWAPEINQASLRMGERLKRLVTSAELIERSDLLHECRHHSVTFGAISNLIGVERFDAVVAFLNTTVVSMVSAAVRLVPLGHTDGQRIINRLHDRVLVCAQNIACAREDDIAGFAPLHEWACVAHESLYSRLFQS